MAASSDLFELIKSLSKSEKRYFRMWASLNSRSRVNRYVRLFDLIDARDVHDEDGVRETFTARHGSKHFAEAKYYLYNAILRALHSYALDRSVGARLSTALHQAELLYERRLHRQCIKLLERTREQAIELELWHYAAEAAKLEIRTRKFWGAEEGMEIERLLDEVTRHGEAWSEDLRQWQASSHLDLHETVTGPARDGAGVATYWKIFDAHGAASRGTPSSPRAAYYYFNSLALCQKGANDFRAALASHRSILALVDSGQLRLQSDDTVEAIALLNVCAHGIYACDEECFREHYPRLLERTDRPPSDPLYLFRIHALALLPHFHGALGEFDRALRELPAVEHALAASPLWSGVGIESTINRLGLGLAFGAGDYTRCVDYLNTLLAMRSFKFSSHLHAHFRLIQLIVHFERGDYDLLESLLRSAHRYFLSRELHGREEMAIIDFVRRALRSGSMAELRAPLRELHATIAPLREASYGSIFIEMVDIPAWIESRLTGRSYAAITRDHFLMRSACNADAASFAEEMGG
jgi:hypothetical protein